VDAKKKEQEKLELKKKQQEAEQASKQKAKGALMVSCDVNKKKVNHIFQSVL
jgi:hypothetical protein